MVGQNNGNLILFLYSMELNDVARHHGPLFI